MEPTLQPKPKSNVRDFFINLGAFVAMYVSVVALLNLLFTVINTAYPQIQMYYYGSTASISFPVATLIIFFPIFVLLMGVLQRSYMMEPEAKSHSVHRWLVFITLFVSGLTLAADLVTVLYYFIDGQELTGGFLLKILSVFVVALAVFLYFIADLRSKLTPASRKVWIAVTTLIVLASIIWGFVVIGSPRSQRLYRYDEGKVVNLRNLSSDITSYYSRNQKLPETISDLQEEGYGYPTILDSQTNKEYEYSKISETSYEICAVFNKASRETSLVAPDYAYHQPDFSQHPAGRYCFKDTINPKDYPKVPSMME